MVKISHKKRNLFVTVVFFLTTLLLIPAANGAGGLSIGTAPTLEPGNYPNEIRDVAVYYNISGNIGSNLIVTITYELTDKSQISLHAPNGTILDNSNTQSGVDAVSTICDSNQLYTINITDPATNGVGNHPYTLTIALDGDGIPGFDLLVAFWGIMMLLGLVIFYKRRQSISI